MIVHSLGPSRANSSMVAPSPSPWTVMLRDCVSIQQLSEENCLGTYSAFEETLVTCSVTRTNSPAAVVSLVIVPVTRILLSGGGRGGIPGLVEEQAVSARHKATNGFVRRGGFIVGF